MYVSDIYTEMGRVTKPVPANDPYHSIHSGTWEGEELGFTKELFNGIVYKDDSTVYIAYIRSLNKRQGNVKKFYQSLLNKGYEVAVIDPCPEMTCLCESMGMEYRYDFSPPYGENKEYYWSKPTSQ